MLIASDRSHFVGFIKVTINTTATLRKSQVGMWSYLFMRYQWEEIEESQCSRLKIIQMLVEHILTPDASNSNEEISRYNRSVLFYKW